MGISGLLPLLKSIQVNKHLSEFAGQTLAVDAYVWLHRGIHTCAPEIATGKDTTKYVDYAMHRVRLLRHHHIQPYVVFDGGPLPAKKGTESERKQRREENLSRANALVSQGKHSQAREYYVKCVDVTPQMAFQLIKALRAESIPYIVAPYEADAQLAYLERIGLADGVITEDSDLLVFGCRNVLFKLDAVTSTVSSISRSDFGAVTSSDTGGISLLGWSDVQFRAMAILSGCDYLPSIPGVGLKTAWALLRKHKSAENAIRALRLEGKKPVPKGYLAAFQLAEKVFLHQRVYDPIGETLVHMTGVPDGTVWDDVTESYVGRDIEPGTAKKLALGDVDPISLLPIVDINPGYVARTLKPLPLTKNLVNTSWKGKDKAVPLEKSASTGILKFFTPKTKMSSVRQSFSQPATIPIEVGRASGKRTLREAMDYDNLAKKRKFASTPAAEGTAQSRFFENSTPCADKSQDFDLRPPIAGPGTYSMPLIDETDSDSSMEVMFDMEQKPDTVAQEDGYLSPSPGSSRSRTPDFSSPVRAGQMDTKRGHEPQTEADEKWGEWLSSPVARRQDGVSPSISPVRRASPKIQFEEIPPYDHALVGPDLRDVFDDVASSDIFDDPDSSRAISPSTPKHRPEENGLHSKLDWDDLEDFEPEGVPRPNEVVVKSWRNRWTCGFDQTQQARPRLKRHETNVTAVGRHGPIHIQGYTPRAVLPIVKRGSRKSLNLLQCARTSTVTDVRAKVVLTPEARFERFRCKAF